MYKAALHGSKILILDDTADNVRLLELILRKAGYWNLLLLTDSREFQDQFLAFKPDLVLLDLMMPHLDGFQVLDIINAHRGEQCYLPVLVISADIQPESRNRALDSGAEDFVVKPFDAKEVDLRVRILLHTRKLHLDLMAVKRKLEAHNQALDYQSRERTSSLEHAHFEALYRLALVAEYRDDDTGEHTQRVGKMAEELALRAGVPDTDARLLGLAAPLHDIGKIGIPDAVLLKPGKLDPREIDVMRSHTSIGAKMLAGSKSSIFIKGEEIALSHHERWDGTGYPFGLRGDQIPLAGRIVAVVDVFDALSNDRPYRRAWKPEAVREHMFAGAGSHFDPELLNVFSAADSWG